LAEKSIFDFVTSKRNFFIYLEGRSPFYSPLTNLIGML